ncbi:MAG: DUF4294 domain-containing protein [Culturomica sp.]|jgi:hypothetical protein|nr:DUF4294 domain-containing protein [Culturomica sp.]
MLRTIIGFISVLVFLTAMLPEVSAQLVAQDTVMRHIVLDEVIVYPKKTKPTGKQQRHAQRMQRLEYNVRKAYPFAVIAAKKINEIEIKISKVSSKKEKEKIIKEEYKDLMRTFKKPLMKLTISQGRILIKLIYRETSASSFSHIREYRGGFNAYFWQSIALLFGNNLKSDYEPYGEDAEIEKIVKKIENENTLFRNFVE